MVPEMPNLPPRSLHRASWGAAAAASRSSPRTATVHPARNSPTVGPAPAAIPATLKILVAGVDKDARALVEDTVRRALGSRAVSEPWTVSLVRLGAKWSVTLDGPGDRFRNVSFTADEDRLGVTIREFVEGNQGGSAGAPAARAAAVPASAPPLGEVRDRHVCERCHQAVLVVYESQPDEPRQRAPLACPHCWTINQVEIGAWAAAGGDYRAEKA